ncbi:MAG: hypothetical protein ACRDI2_20260, partial [Chloroflexota bacterium]
MAILVFSASFVSGVGWAVADGGAATIDAATASKLEAAAQVPTGTTGTSDGHGSTGAASEAQATAMPLSTAVPATPTPWAPPLLTLDA